MKLWVLSDLHLESSQWDVPTGVEADVVVLAGDIHTGTRGMVWARAARIGVSPATYKRIEAGDPAVAFGSWMTAFMQMQLLAQIVAATTPAADKLGEALRELKAPKRIRSKKAASDDRYDF